MAVKTKVGICAYVLLSGLLISDVGHAASPNDILVIVNNSLPVDQTTVDELKQIFLKRKTTWRNGERIVCINAPDNDDIRSKFRQLVLEMSPSAEAAFWEKQKVRKQLTEPAEMRSIPKAVFKLKNAISYAYRKDVPENVVKVILVIPGQ